jgi:hypothetical protein
MTGSNDLQFAPPVSMFCAVSKRGGTGYQTIYANGTLAGGIVGYGIWISDTSDNSGAFSSQYRNASNASTNYYTATLPSLNVFFIGSSLVDSSTNKVFFNNGSEDSISHTITGTPNQPVTIGHRSASANLSHFLNGDIAELIVYNASLSAANRESVRDYLNTKWSIY